ncbi:MAG: SUMF1/EgtB/PvdO family nonheme iron enzyme [Candidatus Marinimicrobia bacterium]|jgi:formylglycine-generating enzyme required for sulfatase activity|nr:SUMF1/EgtB/PvdO family nonheme iron enzyme [Candidatus Neomarinimicrobiota bacterium]MBT3576972.1 SUMF1/EgtB/PvdO family nonheme iron enzyme [Candidatus Neomarinimicrobiota bacterium]MBT3680150.1 SUMF1/EgtB/PvdO family nonheme iron enzyme [Candidatus Neomarinimicrobiota bacterium]MBT3951361.1 SUMF1/EgtB/PvdO family nonheme iron enzyme [Candidatus Neomarinimicrobiota bacterium]MBT4253936.1 SUMF1/EgtB/PvdO family nonheme iron enzyme [Candidatus Neomarinimicrobiota bacterium]
MRTLQNTFFISLLVITGLFAEKPMKFVDTGINPSTWALVPAGEFYFGQHQHVVDIDYDYEIMITDVTNRQYANYLNEALEKGTVYIKRDTVWGYHPGDPFDAYLHEYEIPAGDYPHVPITNPGLRLDYEGGMFNPKTGYGNHPMVEVSWFGAKAYADFYDYRLPTEKEWEKSARGTTTDDYPWGNTVQRNQANFVSSHNLFEKMFGDVVKTTPVGFYNGKNYDGYQTMEGITPYGLYDMAGNVYQWTGDDHPKVHYRYMRGGSYQSYEYSLRVWPRNSAGPEHTSMSLGFRCARTPVQMEIAPTDTSE